MDHGGVHLDRETFSCSICLELLKEPVTVPCGHSYCLCCIKHHWDGEGQEGLHSCPECRKSFRSRPELLQNTMLAAVVEQLKKAGVGAAPADHCYAGDEDVACDVCTGRKLKALKSCLVCLASYCGNHLQPHLESPAFAKHQLVEPKILQENICCLHNEVMKMFCRSDGQSICCLCFVNQHKGHDVVSAAAERKQTIQRRIQEREDGVKVLQQEMKDIDVSADEAVQHSQKIYSQLIRLMEKRSSDIEQHIRSQKEAELSRLRELQEKLEQEIKELQQLYHSEDHRSSLLNDPSASHLAVSSHSPNVPTRPHRYFENLTAAVSESGQNVQRCLRVTWRNISLTRVNGSLSAEPRTREEFLRYSCDVTLDPNTANRSLKLSEDKRRATVVKRRQPYLRHPDRFVKCSQIMSRESLTGRHYWEVKLGKRAVNVAVAYKNIRKSGDECTFGHNSKSWTLDCYDRRYEFWSNADMSVISGPWSSTVGVYLDHPAGLLSYYSVSDTMTLLHRVQTSFTRPLHVGLGIQLSVGSSAELVKLG